MTSGMTKYLWTDSRTQMTLMNQFSSLKDLEPDSRNVLNSFLPYRKGAKEFNFNAVGGVVLSNLLGKQVKGSLTFEKYKELCLERLASRLSDESALVDLEKMYFEKRTIVQSAPEFLLLEAKGGNASTKHLSRTFSSFLDCLTESVEFESASNFIEKLFLDVLGSNLEEAKRNADESCYLPFVAEQFEKDVCFLAKHPDYLLEQIENCVELYTFIYCSQLGVNIKNWRDGSEPKSRPLYFILDTEKASAERIKVHNEGYRSLRLPMPDVFPILSMLEYLNKNADQANALWRFSNEVRSASSDQQKNAYDAIIDFAERFRVSRKLSSISPSGDSPIDALDVLFKYAVQQFGAGTGRNRVQNQYMEVFEKRVAKSFLQRRGRAGNVLVLNQDFVLLLTNLAVGDRKNLRFQEVLREFKQRGFYFDKKSQQALIRFYERVGNVDRLSDSGDAVYVRNTI